jgi:type I restriction enzyme M protein
MGRDSEEDFEGLFEDLDLGSSKLGKTENQKNELIAKVLVHLDQIDFRLDDTEADVLGDAYEYLIGQFASGAGKKAGEFYTPQQVSTIRERKAIEKFSHVAALSEVAENEYNLNIPRYVETFEEEDPVDLADVSAKLAAL